MEPLIFEPYFRPQIWGNRRLASVLNKPLPEDGQFGESWEISAHPHAVTTVAQGPHAGTPLTELWEAERDALWASNTSQPVKFPWLIKYLDCDALLSVQVHPDDEAAAKLLSNESGKTEAWVVLAAEPEAELYLGLKDGVTETDLRRHLKTGTVDSLLHKITPKPGDCVLIEAGTVHTAGKGVLLAEVQQSSDATFRLFDWNRKGPDGNPRKLHIEEAIASIDWNRGPVTPVVPKPQTGLPDGVIGEHLAACRYFRLDRFTLHKAWEIASPRGMEVWMVLDGSAELSTGTFTHRLVRGRSVLIPASCPPYRWTPIETPTVLLRCSAE
ncbi:class I mannose-6-phosphate isomerase [Thermostilla marina]